MVNVALIALCGGLGCLSRYFLSGWVYDWLGKGFPFGTLAVNILGAFIIGFLMEFSLHSTLIPPSLRIGLTVGFLGGLTTFSTFSYETFRLIEDGEILFAGINAAGSVVVCVFFAWVGIILARAI
jgi:CrcB protein